MTDYVLVHGAGHAKWCWEPMIPYLEECLQVGEVVAVDLIGHGARLNEKPQDQITLDDYIGDIAGTIQDRDLRNVILVGHSLAGVSIPQAAKRVSDRVKRLIFVSAAIPPDGKSALETFQNVGIGVSYAGGDLQNHQRHAYCNDMDETKAQWLLGKLGPEPPAGLTTPVNRSGLSGSIAKTYVLLTMDKALPLDVQRKFADNIGNPELIELESGHDAMISHPRELAQVLLKYADKKENI